MSIREVELANQFALGDFSGSSFVREAQAYLPTLRERAPRQWAETSILSETIAEMKDRGFFQMLQPKRWGGHECLPLETFEVTSLLSEADPSVGWVLGVLGIHAFHLAMFSEEAQAEVWGSNPKAMISSPYAPGKAIRVPGGYRLSGRWGFSSGGEHCDWTFLGANVEGETSTRPPGFASHTLLLPRKDYEIIKNWNVYGLRATGSNDVVVNDVFVPEHRALEWSLVEANKPPGLEKNNAMLYRIPFFQIFSRATPTPCALGALKGMADEFVSYTRERAAASGRPVVADAATTLAVARALSILDELKGAVYKNYARLVNEVAGGAPISIDERRKFRFQAAQIPQRCTELATEMYRVAGGSAIFETRPFGRLINDMFAIQTHRLNNYQPHANAWIGTLMGDEKAAAHHVA
jgi:3-hydroxy-9,10-secoandrosta-1,3,5(10)-triene-9,17-dione monooxygenase